VKSKKTILEAELSIRLASAEEIVHTGGVLVDADSGRGAVAHDGVARVDGEIVAARLGVKDLRSSWRGQRRDIVALLGNEVGGVAESICGVGLRAHDSSLPLEEIITVLINCDQDGLAKSSVHVADEVDTGCSQVAAATSTEATLIVNIELS
jgi:hypothetical protein